MVVFSHVWPTPRTLPGRAIVLGCRGFVGKEIVAALERHGVPHLGIAASQLDLTLPRAGDALARLLLPEDSLVILSALTPEHGRGVPTFMANLKMIESVCTALDRRPVGHVVYIGSDAVYADTARPVNEVAALGPNGLYGVMHLAREEMLRATVKGPLAVLRLTMVCGAHDTHSAYGPNRFRRAAADTGQIPIFGGGEERRDHIDVTDVATVVRMVLQRRSEGTLNVATGCSPTFREVAELVAKQFPNEIAIIEQPRQAGLAIIHRRFDVSVLHAAFPDFRPLLPPEAIARAHRESGITAEPMASGDVEATGRK